MRATERDDEQHEAPSQRAVAPASRTKRHVSPSAGLGFRTSAGLAGGARQRTRSVHVSSTVKSSKSPYCWTGALWWLLSFPRFVDLIETCT